MNDTPESAASSPRPRWQRYASVIAVVSVTLIAGAAIGRSTAPPAPSATSTPGTKQNAAGVDVADRRLVTYRGEVVDYYCYIEKGLRGPGHLECAVKCVSGDICMGLVTQEGDLYMISVNHLRAMDPLAFKGIPDPFNRCRGLLSETVDLTGYVMGRKGQKIIEIMDVKPVGPSPK
ncbi:MAG TPA: hypothetical protein VFS09_08910 [Candidatus Eisenbacteria bacterium]|nr:hypothetical protein [Candidatus Eisenbacteria bacterium]